MAPKRPPPADAAPPPKKRKCAKPLTTREKEAAAAEAKPTENGRKQEEEKKTNKREAVSPESPKTTSPFESAKKAKPKARSFPPPDETALNAKLNAERRAEKAKQKKKQKAASKPLTTREKLTAAAKKKGKEDAAQKKAAKAGEHESVSKRTGGVVIEKASLDMGRTLEGYTASNNNMYPSPTSSKQPQRARASVLVRPTARTKLARASSSSSCDAQTVSTTCSTSEGPKDTICRLLTLLPKAVRARIWREVVVHPLHFIWPENKLDREQPDIAQTCRAIRREVLPLYYSENIFAVDVSPPPPAAVDKGKGRGGEGGLAALRKWSEVLSGKAEGEGGWFGSVRSWAFVYSPSTTTGAAKRGDKDDIFVVSVRFRRKGQHDPGAWDAEVEVHANAGCILPGRDEYLACVVKLVPEWLNKVVFEVADAARAGSIGGEVIARIGEVVRDRAVELVEVRC